MNAPRRPGPSRTESADSAGSVHGGRMWRPSVGYLVAALGLAVGGLAFLWMSPSLPGAADDAASAASATPAVMGTSPATGPVQASGTAAAWPPAMPTVTPGPAVSPRKPEGDADPTRDITSYIVRGEKPTMPEVIERLHQAGVYEGLGAFSPPGTRPPLIGLAVPENFVLPEGYVRHHQATDDGQRIEAILMFAPDRQFFDAANKPIAIPKDRVVPPEYAPPGLPIRRIVLPAPIDPSGR